MKAFVLKMDRRAQRTRDALRSAFVQLVLSRGYDVVSIGDICNTANVGRSTFYSHYQSKQNLLEESLQGLSSGLAACVAADATPQGLLPLLAHFREQKRVNRVFFETPIRGIWVRTLARVIEARLPRGSRSRLKALLVAELQIALLIHWLSGKFSLQPEAVAAMLITNTQTLLANK
ncbi:MAG TPA: TetR/AcrR family transcriptional regulator [Steroidobacteraceae bacterium]